MKYAILAATSKDELEKKVNAEISLGWQPTGGIAVTIGPGNQPLFLQAMTKKA